MNLTTKLHQYSYRLIPGQCLLCRRATGRHLDICAECEIDLPWLRSFCPYCGEPAPGNLPCARCLTNLPPYSAALAGFEYRFPIDALIHRFKDARHLAAGLTLTHLSHTSHQRVLRSISWPDLIIVPVPLHPRKQRSRGFNQSALIAEQLSELIPARLDCKVLVRVSDTRDQKTLSLPARKQNLKNSFEVRRNLQGHRILLVDDVITTGATVTEITACLLQWGAADVVVFAIARTPSNHLMS